MIKRGDKQFRRTLRTKDRKLAERRLSELQSQIGNLTIADDARLTFDSLGKRWMPQLRTPSNQLSDTAYARKQFRRIATRYEKHALTLLAMLHLVSVFISIRN